MYFRSFAGLGKIHSKGDIVLYLMGNILVSIVQIHPYTLPGFVIIFVWIIIVIYAIYKLIVEKVAHSKQYPSLLRLQYTNEVFKSYKKSYNYRIANN